MWVDPFGVMFPRELLSRQHGCWQERKLPFAQVTTPKEGGRKGASSLVVLLQRIMKQAHGSGKVGREEKEGRRGGGRKLKDDVLMTSLVIMKRESSKSDDGNQLIKRKQAATFFLHFIFVSFVFEFTQLYLLTITYVLLSSPTSTMGFAACNSSFLFNLPHLTIFQ